MSNQQKWYIREGDQINGPYTPRQTKQLAENGTIRTDTEVRLGEDGRWVSANKVRGLFVTQLAANSDINVWPASMRTGSRDSSHEGNGRNDASMWPLSMRQTGSSSVPDEEMSEVTLATDRQKEYARSLGIEFSDTVTRSKMSTLIAKAVAKRDAERFEELNELNQQGSDAWNQMREDILAEIDAEDCRLSTANPTQMVQELSEQRELVAVLLTMPWNGIKDFEDLSGHSLSLNFGDDLTMQDVEAVIMQAANEIMKRKGMGAVSMQAIDDLNREFEALKKEVEIRNKIGN